MDCSVPGKTTAGASSVTRRDPGNAAALLGTARSRPLRGSRPRARPAPGSCSRARNSPQGRRAPPASPCDADPCSLAAGSPREGRGWGIRAAARPEMAAVMGGGAQILLF